MFGLSFTIAPFAIICGATVQISKKYVPINYIGWILMIIGFGLLTTLDQDSSVGKCIGFQVITGSGLGIIWVGTQFAILAPLPYSNNAHALAFFTFVRTFSQVSVLLLSSGFLLILLLTLKSDLGNHHWGCNIAEFAPSSSSSRFHGLIPFWRPARIRSYS